MTNNRKELEFEPLEMINGGMTITIDSINLIAADDASGYAISEKMRVNIRS